MVYEVMRKYLIYILFVLTFIFATYVNCLIQTSAGVSPNVYTTIVPGIIGALAVWRHVRRMNKTRKL